MISWVTYLGALTDSERPWGQVFYIGDPDVMNNFLDIITKCINAAGGNKGNPYTNTHMPIHFSAAG